MVCGLAEEPTLSGLSNGGVNVALLSISLCTGLAGIERGIHLAYFDGEN